MLDHENNVAADSSGTESLVTVNAFDFRGAAVDGIFASLSLLVRKWGILNAF